MVTFLGCLLIVGPRGPAVPVRGVWEPDWVTVRLFRRPDYPSALRPDSVCVVYDDGRGGIYLLPTGGAAPVEVDALDGEWVEMDGSSGGSAPQAGPAPTAGAHRGPRAKPLPRFVNTRAR